MTEIRSAAEDDMAHVAAVYAHHVRVGLGSFEVVAPGIDEVAQRWRAIADQGLPYLVAVRDGRIAGFAYANAFRPRPGYRHTVENSVYVAPDHAGHGVGRALLGRLIECCEALGLRQMVAVIGDSGNRASVELHRAHGFEITGTLRDVGRKHERWIDVVIMQRALGEGASTPPPSEP